MDDVGKFVYVHVTTQQYLHRISFIIMCVSKRNVQECCNYFVSHQLNTLQGQYTAAPVLIQILHCANQFDMQTSHPYLVWNFLCRF